MASQRLSFTLENINYWLIGALLFFLPFEVYPFLRFRGVELRPSQIIVLAIIVINLPKLWPNKTKLLQNPWIFLVLFLTIAGVSLLYNGPNKSGLYTVGLYGFEFLLALTISQAVQKANLKTYRNIILISCGLAALFGLWQLAADSAGVSQVLTLLGSRYIHQIFGYPRIHGFSLEPLFFANVLFIPLCLALISWVVEKKALFFWLSVAFAVVILLTISRSAWLGLAIVFCIVAVTLVIQKHYAATLKLLGGFGLSLLLAGSMIAFSSAVIHHNAARATVQPTTQVQFVDASQNTSTLARSTSWKIAARQVARHPIIGVGPSNIQAIIRSSLSPQEIIQAGNTKANNVYLEIGSEDGLLGGLLLLAFLAGLVWLGLRASKKQISSNQKIWIYGIALVSVPFAVQWLVVSNLAVTHTWILIGILISIVGTSKISAVESMYQKIRKNLWLEHNKWALVIMIVTTLYYLLFEFLLYRKFQFPMLDLGMFNRHMYGLAHYGLDINPLKGYNLLGDHAHFFLLPLVPLYYVWQSPQFLLVLQVLCISLSGWPIYLIAKKFSPNAKLAALWLLPYFTYFGFWSALAYPFHDSPAAVLPLAWALYFLLVSKNWRRLCIALVILMLFREDMPLVALMVGIYLIVIEREYWLGAGIAVVSSAYFFWVTKLWLPIFGPTNYGYEKTQFGSSSMDVLRAAVTKPLKVIKSFFLPREKIKNMAAMLLSFGGFGVFALEMLIILLPLWLGRFLSIEAWRWGPMQHYSASQAPILAVAAIVGLYRIIQYVHLRFGYNKRQMFMVALSFAILLSFGINLLLHQRAIIKPLALQFYRLTPTEQSARQALAIIPPNASVGAQSAFPQLSSRQEIYNLPLPEGAQPQYIVLANGLDAWPFSSTDNLLSYKAQLEANGYNQIFSQNGVFVLQK